ncbi:MAG TPA: hypothetical protein VJ728_13860 [Candidatus Binataceae bacterium]|nr:hypothetical protein [Candidatus Binataceae bacterium]
MSEGQPKAPENQAQRALAAGNACRKRHTARENRLNLLRDILAHENGIGRKLTIAERMVVFDEWYRLSLPYLDPAKSYDTYLAAFITESKSVRVPSGAGALAKAMAAVCNLGVHSLPVIPQKPDACETWRRLAALHRELSYLCGGNVYFLSYRSAAKVIPRMSPGEAYNITIALDTFGVIRIVSKGESGVRGKKKGKAAEFLYLLGDDDGMDL